jgi:fructan beta-fructosidase
MKLQITAIMVLCLLTSAVTDAAERKIKITKQYLNFPISHDTERKPLTFTLNGRHNCTSVIRLAEGKPQYWVFQDVSLWKGKTLVLSGDFSEKALQSITLSDTIVGQSMMYKEALRPQYHFTARRGWINDPNGLIYYNNRYHLFFQHNPYEREWENMHWGHAVSTDLLHWTELPLALHPDSIGTMFSGTAVIDYDNTLGLPEKQKEPAMVAFYTANGEWQTQCMAYSTDEGLTWTKYKGNPVIDSHLKWQSHDTRDPKVFWYAPAKHWVMAVNERDGNTIYNSYDLKKWTEESHITGFWECPELFQIAVEGSPEETHWVMWGASGTYMIGQFDGKRFTPETNKLQNLFGSAYAAQTFNNIPADDGRVIKMAWGRLSFGDMPFNGCMLLPQEQILKRTKQGLRLYSRPIAETENLFFRECEASNVSAEEANEMMKKFASDDLLRIKATLQLTYATDAGISFCGQRLLNYDMNSNCINNHFYSPDEPSSMTLDVDLYVDRSMAEVFIDGGAMSYSMGLDGRENKGYEFFGNNLRLKHLEVYKLKR